MFVDFKEPLTEVLQLILQEPGIVQQVAKTKQQFRLHAASNVSGIFSEYPLGKTTLQRATDTGVRTVRVALSFLNLTVNPVRVSVADDTLPRLPQKEKAL